MGLAADGAALRRTTLGRLLVLSCLLVVGVAGAAYYFGLGKPRQEEEKKVVSSVLVVGPRTHKLGMPLEFLGFAAKERVFSQAMEDARARDSSASDRDALLRLAREDGHGYVAIHPPHLIDYGTEAPAGATVAIIAVNTGHVTFGVPAAGIDHLPPAGLKVGLLLALQDQPDIAALIAEPNPELPEVDVPARFQRLAEAQRVLAGYQDAWQTEIQTDGLTPLGHAFEPTDAFPLANGGIVTIGAQRRWKTDNGIAAELTHPSYRVARYLPPELVRRGAGLEGEACGPLAVPNLLAIRTSADGEAIAIQRFAAKEDRWVIDVYTLDGPDPDCPFAPTGTSMRSRWLHKLGPTHRSGEMLSTTDRWRRGEPTDWNHPRWLYDPDAAWVDIGLAAFVGASARRDRSVHGLGFMTTSPADRREALLPSLALFKHTRSEEERLTAVYPGGTDRLLVAASNCHVYALRFKRPLYDRLVPVKTLGGLAPRTTIRSRRVWEVTELLSYGGCEPIAFDAVGETAVMEHRGRLQVIDLRDPDKPSPLLPKVPGDISHFHVAPGSRFVIVHTAVKVLQATTRTAFLLPLGD